MKEFLENNAYFVDFFNAYFFDGKRVLKPENCMELDSEMNDSNMDLEKHVDVIRKYNDGNLYSAFIIENQSYVDMSMVVRAAVYEYVAYERMLKKSKKNKDNKKLPMVHILVFYTGERPWNAARQLSELVEVDERFKACLQHSKAFLLYRTQECAPWVVFLSNYSFSTSLTFAHKLHIHIRPLLQPLKDLHNFDFQ